MTKKKKIVLGASGGCLVPLVLVFVVASYFSPGGLRSTYPASDYDPLLTKVAGTALPVIKAIDRYRGEHSSLPASMADLAPYLPARPKPPKVPNPQSATRHWWYTRINATCYELGSSVGWDPTLNYRFEGSKGYWYFDPGDGSGEFKIIKLKPSGG
jgi:hypothetical protein